MKKENIKRKKKIAVYSVMLLFLLIAYVIQYVMDVLKRTSKILAYGDPMLVKLYTNIFICFIVLLIICIVVTVLTVIILSTDKE